MGPFLHQVAVEDAAAVGEADCGEWRDSRVLVAVGEEEAAWTLPTGKGVQTRWLEFEPVPPR